MRINLPTSAGASGLLLASLLALGACSDDTIDVTRATRLSAVGPGTPFTVVLTKEEENDPEFRYYAGVLVNQLERQGLTPVSHAAQARYAVMLFQDGPDPIQGFDDALMPTPQAATAGLEDTGPGAGGYAPGGRDLPGVGAGGIGGNGGMGGMGSMGGMGGMEGIGGGRDASWGGAGRSHELDPGHAGEDPRPSTFRIAIFDLTRPQSPDEKVFDAKVSAIARHGGTHVVAAMMAAALKGFPGRQAEDFSVPMPEVRHKQNS